MKNEIIENIFDEVEKVIHGKRDKIEKIFAAWLCEGHVLLEDVPGTGKTILSKTFSKVLGLDYKRIQFTADLLPSDITGGLFLDPTKKTLVLRRGPVFTSIFLGDEINRASPRTQSALLECMAEKQVTIDGQLHHLDEFFFVLATQNPIEQHGTFPLPEAQLDRFIIKLSLGCPEKDDEIEMIKNRILNNPIATINSVVSREELKKLRTKCESVKIDECIYDYTLELINRTRNHQDISLGASPRSSLALIRYAQALSLIDGLNYITPKTIYECFRMVINHRIHISPEARFSGKNVEDIIQEILESVKVPILK